MRAMYKSARVNSPCAWLFREQKIVEQKKKKGITYWESIQLEHLLPGRNGVK